MAEYGFKPGFVRPDNCPSCPRDDKDLSYPHQCPNDSWRHPSHHDRHPEHFNRHSPPPVYPSLPPESSPCSHSTNFRPIHPLSEFKKAYYWVDTTAYGGVPTTALHGGVDIDGEQIYVGRAYHEGDWIPAKVIPGRHVAYVAYDGREHEKEQFQVLCEQRFDWIPTRDGYIPPGAVEGGKTCDGETLYIGRVYHNNSQTVGKVHPSHGSCYIPFDGKELAFKEYEILVLRA